MAPQTGKIGKRPPAERPTHTAGDLIRLLVSLSGSPDDRVEDGNGQATEEIILEADLDGARYVLIRIPHVSRPRVQLSPREQEIVRMVAEGHSNKIIAKVLSISSWTVCTHLRRIFAKLGVGSRAAMVARLIELWGPREHSFQRLTGSSSPASGDQRAEVSLPKPR
jgi:DNA-binding CsgD family transcriptional regulator